jgi:hypothetical protein
MNTEDIRDALAPFESGTLAVVRLQAEGGGFIELLVERIDYVPADGDRDAYIALVPRQTLTAK